MRATIEDVAEVQAANAAATPTDLPKFSRLAALIPAWQPEPALVSLVSALVQAGFPAIIVVDDGSSRQHQTIFEQVAAHPQVRLLRHAVNMGKGRALKTGLNYFLNHFRHFSGVVTADADGQHTPEDILDVAAASANSPNRLLLGARQFSGEVPLRSRIGNVLTRNVFRFLTGRKLADTQSGLRVIPTAFIPELLTLPGERYEYEMTMLTHVCRSNQAPIEVPIQTVYIEGNRTSHFNPIWDSMRIYFILFRFYMSSLIAAGIDLLGFTLMFWATHNILASVIFGRLSSLANFVLNKRFVFNSRASVTSAIWRYYVLAAAIALVSYLSIRALAALGWNVIAAKVIVDSLLSLVSFSIQRTFVFGTPAEEQ